ncbi:MAG: hypothetical protein KDI88_04060 [Gammaproteobacteria bacterium]|nr:hypothetical protein [Gammaproteobacteria bacterium]
MKILAHRGDWSVRGEHNSRVAFERAFDGGFGVETDVRDYCGELVISHDVPQAGAMPFREFLSIYRRYPSAGTLAVNIKADGLQSRVKAELAEHSVTDYFVFDMSVPDTLGYVRDGIRFFTRVSELEKTPALYEDAAGVWLDMFFSEWADVQAMSAFLQDGKDLCIVSPELHGRDYHAFWQMLKVSGIDEKAGCMICTDEPGKAARYFG